jgi:hypothetical protein
MNERTHNFVLVTITQQYNRLNQGRAALAA